jgi:hypothetical protein
MSADLKFMSNGVFVEFYGGLGELAGVFGEG